MLTVFEILEVFSVLIVLAIYSWLIYKMVDSAKQDDAVLTLAYGLFLHLLSVIILLK